MRAPILVATLLTSVTLILASATSAQPRPAQSHPGGKRPLRDIDREEFNAAQQRRELQRLVDEGKKIAVRWQKTPRDEYEFICENHTFSDYSIEVSFPELINLQADFSLPAIVEVAPGNHTMFTLRKAAAGHAAHFRYHAEAGDTVYAARRGRVTDVSDGANLQDSNYTYAQAENFIEIEHNDYTFAKYSVLKDGAIFVHPGDMVEAGQPIGIVGGEKYSGGPQVRFCVFYQLREQVVDKEGNSTDKTRNWAYVPVSFWTKQQGRTHLANRSTYTCEDPEELITKEMTKKEARKWKEAHNTAPPAS